MRRTARVPMASKAISRRLRVARVKVAACACSAVPEVLVVLANSAAHKAMVRVGISSARAVVNKDSVAQEWVDRACRHLRPSSRISTPTKTATSRVTNGTTTSRTARNTAHAARTECAPSSALMVRSAVPAVPADVARRADLVSSLAPARMMAKARDATVPAGSLNCRLPRHPNSKA